MGKIILEFSTKYDTGDFVIFEKNDTYMVGMIAGYYVDTNCDDTVFYNIAVNKNKTYTFANGGDVAEYHIIGKITEQNLIDALMHMFYK